MSDVATDRSAVTPLALPDVRASLRSVLDEMSRVVQPLLTLYVDVHTDTDPNAPRQRVDAALRSLDLDRNVRERFEGWAVEALRDGLEGTIVFAAGAGRHDRPFHAFVPRTLPLAGGRTPAVARFGAPWTSPLELLLEDEGPTVVTFVGNERARTFVHDLGRTIELGGYVRSVAAGEWRRFGEHSTGMPGQVARGGAGMDAMDARTEAWTDRFLDHLAAEVRNLLDRTASSSVVVMGRDDAVSRFLRRLRAPDGVQVTSAAAPVHETAEVGAWQSEIDAAAQDALRARRSREIDAAVDAGFTRLDTVLDALVRNRIARVIVARDHDLQIVRDAAAGTVVGVASEPVLNGNDRVSADAPLERAWFKDHAVAVARTGGAGVGVAHASDDEVRVVAVGGVVGVPHRTKV